MSVNNQPVYSQLFCCLRLVRDDSLMLQAAVAHIGGSIPSSSCPCVKVSLSKTLNPELLPMGRLAPCMAAHYISLAGHIN